MNQIYRHESHTMIGVRTDQPTKLFKQRNKNFVQFFCMLLMAIFIGQTTYAQTETVVTNGDFATNTAGWTVGTGWVYNTSTAGTPQDGNHMLASGNAGTTGVLSQSVSGVPANGTILKFKVSYTNTSFTNNANASNVLTVSYAGVDYGRLTTNNATTSSVVALGGATVNTNTVLSYDSDETGGGLILINIVLTLPNGIPNTGLLSFRMAAGSSANVDDINVDKIAMGDFSPLLCGIAAYPNSSAGFATSALALADGGTSGKTSQNIAPGTTFNQVTTVRTDASGNVGVINTIQLFASQANIATCSANTRVTRTNTEQLYLKDPISGGCIGPAIPKTRSGTNSTSFNPEWVALAPNTDYLIFFTTTIDPLCYDYVSSAVAYYGFTVGPGAFTFNCGTATSTGTFVAGTPSVGTLVVPITGATLGNVTLNVAGSGFTGTLTTLLMAGQTSVTIPITYDGTGTGGSKTVTVTSSEGTGTCSIPITVNKPPLTAATPPAQTAITNQSKTGVASTDLAPAGGNGTYVYSVDNTGACTPVVGATALPLSSNLTVTNATTGAYSYTAPSTAGTYYYCIKVCDTSTPTAACLTRTYTLTVSPPPCLAGSTAPIITATTVMNTCPATTFSLAALANTGTKPTGTTLVWSTRKVPTSAGDTLTNLTTVSTAGKYYAMYYDKVANCYSPADSVTATITVCLTINQPATQTGTINTSKSGTVPADVTPTGGLGTITYTNGSTDPLCVPPVGATALPMASNLTISSTGAYSYTVPSTVGTYFFCVKVCDSTTPTPDCKIATYQVTATAVPCNTGTVAPTLTATSRSNVCPATTADLSLLVSSICPVGSALEWHNTNTGLSAATKVANPASVGVGTYYPVCFDAINTCYSPTPTTGVTVTITACCQSGAVAPIIVATTITNTCPTTTFSLAGLSNTGIKPAGTTLIWSTRKVPASAGDTLTNLTTVSTAGKYYAMYYDKVANCYSPADSVTATLTICAINPAGQTATTNQAKTGNASTELTPTGGTSPYIYSVDNSVACTPVVGATALPTASNLTVTNASTGAYSYTAPATAGTYYYCIKVCDSATPTASCVTQTYTLTVSIPPCAVGAVIPGVK